MTNPDPKALAHQSLFDDQARAEFNRAFEVLTRLWNTAQTLPDEQGEAVARDLVAVHDGFERLCVLAQQQNQAFQDAASVLLGTVHELRAQRNAALDDLQSVRRTADQQARTDLARDLAYELDCSVDDARALLNVLIGNPDVPVSGYTMMDLRDALRRLLEEMTDEHACIPSDL